MPQTLHSWPRINKTVVAPHALQDAAAAVYSELRAERNVNLEVRMRPKLNTTRGAMATVAATSTERKKFRVFL